MTETEMDNVLDVGNQTRVYQAAYDLYCRQPDWVTFFRAILGLHGVAREVFPEREALAQFEKTEAYAEIQQMMARLRERARPAPSQQEVTRVITIRLPKSVHEALKVEAHEHCTSMNQLCISKLLRFIDNELVPGDT